MFTTRTAVMSAAVLTAIISAPASASTNFSGLANVYNTGASSPNSSAPSQLADEAILDKFQAVWCSHRTLHLYLNLSTRVRFRVTSNQVRLLTESRQKARFSENSSAKNPH